MTISHLRIALAIQFALVGYAILYSTVIPLMYVVHVISGCSVHLPDEGFNK
jgi:hypothetical protein